MRKLGYILLPFLVVAAGLEYFLFTKLERFRNPTKKEEMNDPSDMLLPSNDITFRTEDGANLSGWLIQGKPGYPALVMGHPYGSNRSVLLVKLEGLITSLNKQGYFVFLFDFRGHGKSGSKSYFGYRESEDFTAAIKAVLQYKQIARRVGVLGVGMGAIAASRSFQSVDEVRCVVLDSIYEDIPAHHVKDIIVEWPVLTFIRPVLVHGLRLNIQTLMRVPDTNLNLIENMPKLYPKGVIFVDRLPASENVKTLYGASKEPKELLQLSLTAADELYGEARVKYNLQVEEKIKKYLPAVSNDRTLEITK